MKRDRPEELEKVTTVVQKGRFTVVTENEPGPDPKKRAPSAKQDPAPSCQHPGPQQPPPRAPPPSPEQPEGQGRDGGDSRQASDQDLRPAGDESKMHYHGDPLAASEMPGLDYNPQFQVLPAAGKNLLPPAESNGCMELRQSSKL